MFVACVPHTDSSGTVPATPKALQALAFPFARFSEEQVAKAVASWQTTTPPIASLAGDRLRFNDFEKSNPPVLKKKRAAVQALLFAPPPFRVFMDGVLKDFYGKEPGNPDPVKKEAVSQAYARFGKAGSYILSAAEGDPVKARECVDAVVARMKSWGMSCQLDTCAKWADEYFANPEGFRNGTNKQRA